MCDVVLSVLSVVYTLTNALALLCLCYFQNTGASVFRLVFVSLCAGVRCVCALACVYQSVRVRACVCA